MEAKQPAAKTKRKRYRRTNGSNFENIIVITLARISSETAFTSAMDILLAALVLPLFCTSTIAQPNIAFTPADKFSIPEYNATISFAVNGTYAQATLENGIWNFADLRLNNSKPLHSLNASARDYNVTVF